MCPFFISNIVWRSNFILLLMFVAEKVLQLLVLSLTGEERGEMWEC